MEARRWSGAELRLLVFVLATRYQPPTQSIPPSPKRRPRSTSAYLWFYQPQASARVELVWARELGRRRVTGLAPDANHRLPIARLPPADIPTSAQFRCTARLD